MVKGGGTIGGAPIGRGVGKPLKFTGGSTGDHNDQGELLGNRGVHTCAMAIFVKETAVITIHIISTLFNAFISLAPFFTL